LQKLNIDFDGVVESPIYAPQEVPLGCKLQRFFRNSAYYMYCLASEKPLRLFIPLIFSGGIWSARGGLFSTPRAFPTGTISDTFYETFLVLGFKF